MNSKAFIIACLISLSACAPKQIVVTEYATLPVTHPQLPESPTYGQYNFTVENNRVIFDLPDFLTLTDNVVNMRAYIEQLLNVIGYYRDGNTK